MIAPRTLTSLLGLRLALAAVSAIVMACVASPVARAADAEYLVSTSQGLAPSRTHVTFDLPAGFEQGTGEVSGNPATGQYERVVPLSGMASECRIGLFVRGAAVTRAPRRAGAYLLVPQPSSFVHGRRLRVAAAGRKGAVRFYRPAVSDLPIGMTNVDGEPGESVWQGVATLPTPRGTGAARRARTTVVVAHVTAAAYGIERKPDGSTETAPATPDALAACMSIVEAEVPAAVRTVLSSVEI